MSIKVKKMLTKSKILLAFISIGFIFFSYSCSTKSYQKDKTYKITVLHTNDHHGRFWKNKNNEYGSGWQRVKLSRFYPSRSQSGWRKSDCFCLVEIFACSESDLQDVRTIILLSV